MIINTRLNAKDATNKTLNTNKVEQNYNKQSNLKQKEVVEESKLDEIIPEDLPEFFSLTEEWADTYIITKTGKLAFAQVASNIYCTYGVFLKEDDGDNSFNSGNYKREELYTFDVNPKMIKPSMFKEILAAMYNEEDLEKNFYDKNKGVGEYLYNKGLMMLNKSFSLIRYCLPFAIFRMDGDEKDVAVIKIKDSVTKDEYLLIIGYFQVITFPCVYYYVKGFFEIYNKNLVVDDIYERY
jgi:hypothetical protein